MSKQQSFKSFLPLKNWHNICDNLSMSVNMYQSHEEPRTAGLRQKSTQSIQSWKARTQSTQTATTPASIKEVSYNETRTVPVKDFQSNLNFAHLDHPSPKPEQPFDFGAVLDVINPLHHIPIVGQAYRYLTDDKLHPMAGIMGGAIYGGPLGAVTGTVNAIAQIQTGQDINDMAFSRLLDRTVNIEA